MKIDLRFLNRPIEDLWCQAVVLLVFQNPTIVNDVLSSINDKMGGSLNDLIKRGIWTGDRGESLLLATQGAIRADKLLMCGLGPENSFDNGVLINEVLRTGIALDQMGVKELGINMQCPDNHAGEYGTHIENVALSIAEAFNERHKDDPEFLLKIFFCIDNGFKDKVDRVITRLKEEIRQGVEFSIISDSQRNIGYQEVK